MTKIWSDLLRRIEAWPDEAQHELATVAREIEAELQGGTYRPTPEELVGIDRGLGDADAGRFASDEEIRAIFAKYRRV